MCFDTDSDSICGYICHNCANYFSIYKKNIIYHITKKNKCIPNTKYSNDEIIHLSQNKQFHFKKNVFENINGDYNMIIDFFTEKHNYINEDYKDIIQQHINNNEKKNKEKNTKSKIIICKKKTNNKKENDFVNEDDSEKENDSENEDNSKKEDIKKNKKYVNKYDIFLNKDNNYECPSCHYIATRRCYIKAHILDITKCEKMKKEYNAFNYYKNIVNNNITESSTQTTEPYIEKSYSEMCIGTDDIEHIEIENKELQVKEEHIYKFFKSKQYDYNTDNCEDIEEYVYMVQKASNVAKKDNIVKIGMTKCNDPFQRINHYERGCKIIQVALVKDAVKVEKELIYYFSQHFTQCKHLGKEMFQGSIQDMIIAFKILT
jgi:hypothetical protein